VLFRSKLKNCIIDRDSRIGDGVLLDDHSAVAAGSVILGAAGR
jgi:hypothetical protein